MADFKRVVIWVSLAIIIALAILSIYGAFIGAERASVFFNSPPLTAYWLFFMAFLLLGFAAYPRLAKKPPLLMMHIGCILIFAGGLWGSGVGHQLQNKYLGKDKLFKGIMVIYEGESENRLLNKQDYETVEKQLDFEIRLDDFHMDYYGQDDQPEQGPSVHITAYTGGHWDIDAVAGNSLEIPGTGTVKVLRVFQRLRILIGKDGSTDAMEDENGSDNQAVEVEIVKADGTSVKKFVYFKFPKFSENVEGLALSCEFPVVNRGMVKDYFSDLVVVKDGKEVLKKTIEVNDPLHYGGYHFYQSSYDSKAGRYTVLSVTSDTGLYTVYAGYFLLCLGVILQFWGKMLFREVANDKAKSEQA